ncbi:uncharacterized protein LOC144117483 [Amblyomma americanum]
MCFFFMMQVSTYFVKEAFNYDKDNVTLKAMPGLTLSHLDPNNFEKMRVTLAFQLFGDRVLRGLHHYKDRLESSYGKGAIDATEKFFRMINELIKTMTSRYKSEALWPNSRGAAALSAFLEYITKWEECTVNGVGFISKTTAVGFRVTLSGVLRLLEYLTKEVGFKYLMTAKLSQDPVENLFGVVRQSSGCNDHPTPEQFLITVNCLSFYSLARPVDGASVEPLVLTALLDTGNTDLSNSTTLEDTIDSYISRGDLDSLEDAASQKGNGVPTYDHETTACQVACRRCGGTHATSDCVAPRSYAAALATLPAQPAAGVEPLPGRPESPTEPVVPSAAESDDTSPTVAITGEPAGAIPEVVSDEEKAEKSSSPEEDSEASTSSSVPSGVTDTEIDRFHSQPTAGQRNQDDLEPESSDTPSEVSAFVLPKGDPSWTNPISQVADLLHPGTQQSCSIPDTPSTASLAALQRQRSAPRLSGTRMVSKGHGIDEAKRQLSSSDGGAASAYPTALKK